MNSKIYVYKFKEKQDICITSKYLSPIRYLFIIKGRIITCWKPGRPRVMVHKTNGIAYPLMWGAEKGTSSLWGSPSNPKPQSTCVKASDKSKFKTVHTIPDQDTSKVTRSLKTRKDWGPAADRRRLRRHKNWNMRSRNRNRTLGGKTGKSE